MTAQAHVIRRNLVEITISSKKDPKPIQDAVSRVMRTALVPAVQRGCDALSRQDTIHRLERVEVDLGRVTGDRFEETLTRSLEPALAAALDAAVRNIETSAGGKLLS